MSSDVGTALRRLVAERAAYLCEYCLLHEDDTFFGCEVDHIISEKHDGPTVADNLAYACAFCHRAKGSDIGSTVWRTGVFSRFFNPRTDRWAVYFALHGVTILPLSDRGEVTVHLLDFNHPDRLLERHTVQALGRYPSAAAVRLMEHT